MPVCASFSLYSHGAASVDGKGYIERSGMSKVLRSWLDASLVVQGESSTLGPSSSSSSYPWSTERELKKLQASGQADQAMLDLFVK